MTVWHFRLLLAFFFAVMGTLLVFRETLFPNLAGRVNPFAGIFAWVMCVWNLAKCYEVWARRRAAAKPVRSPLQPDAGSAEPYEPNPELDFFRRPEDQPGPSPSVNGREGK